VRQSIKLGKTMKLLTSPQRLSLKVRTSQQYVMKVREQSIKLCNEITKQSTKVGVKVRTSQQIFVMK